MSYCRREALGQASQVLAALAIPSPQISKTLDENLEEKQQKRRGFWDSR